MNSERFQKLSTSLSVRRVYKTWYFPQKHSLRKLMLLYLPTQTRFSVGGESVTFCGSTLTNSLRQTIITNSLGKQQLEIYTRTYSGRAPWHLVKFLSQLPLSEQFFASFFLFWVGRYIAKHLWLVQLETVNFVSPRPQCFPWRTKGLGETKLTISFVASAYCFQKSYGLRWHQNS